MTISGYNLCKQKEKELLVINQKIKNLENRINQLNEEIALEALITN